MSYPRCRLCSAELRHTFVDLGMSPPCESYLSESQIDRGETFYPCTFVSVRIAFWSSSGVYRAGGRLLRLCLLLVRIPTPGWRMRAISSTWPQRGWTGRGILRR